MGRPARLKGRFGALRGEQGHGAIDRQDGVVSFVTVAAWISPHGEELGSV